MQCVYKRTHFRDTRTAWGGSERKNKRWTLEVVCACEQRCVCSWGFSISNILFLPSDCSHNQYCMCVYGGGGGRCVLCMEGGEAFTPYWMVITPDRCDGCSPNLALCLHCLVFLWKGITPTLGINDTVPEKTQDANLAVGPDNWIGCLLTLVN